jgi:hypothetical protein
MSSSPFFFSLSFFLINILYEFVFFFSSRLHLLLY